MENANGLLQPTTQIGEAVKMFLAEQSGRYSPRTMIVYSRALILLQQFCGNTSLANIYQAVNGFREFVQAKYRPATARTYAAAVNRLSQWVQQQMGISLPGLPTLPGQSNITYLSEDELQRLLDVARSDQRDWLLVNLLLLGLRPGEIARLTSSSLLSSAMARDQQYVLHVRYHRGRKVHERWICVPDEIARSLLAYAERARNGGRLFLSVRAMEVRLRHLGNRANLPDLRPMVLRWTAIVRALREESGASRDLEPLRIRFGISRIHWGRILRWWNDHQASH